MCMYGVMYVWLYRYVCVCVAMYVCSVYMCECMAMLVRL